MNRRQLEYFIETYKYCSIKKASEKLCITPQGLSKMIISLENDLQQKLFIRKGNKLAVTEYADILFPHACNIIDEYNYIENREIYRAKIKIASVNQVFNSIFQPLLIDYYKDNPNVDLEIIEGTNSMVNDLIEHEQCDIGFIQNHTMNGLFRSHFLLERSFCAVINTKHPLSRKSVLEAKDFDRQRVAGRGVQCVRFHKFITSLNREKIYPQIVMESMNDDISIKMARENMAIALVPKDYALKHPDNSVRVVDINAPLDSLYIIMNNTTRLGNPADEFYSFVISWVGKNLTPRSSEKQQND